MTESEWLACTDPERLLAGAPESVSRRKRLLLACACARRAWRLVPAEPSDPLAKLESMAEGAGAYGEHGAVTRALAAVRLCLARAADARTGRNHRLADGHSPGFRNLVRGIATAARLANAAARAGSSPIKKRRHQERQFQRGLIRDVFGNPFRTHRLDPAWLAANDGAARTLARASYEENDFRRLPILADALEDAGCADADVLGHCRAGGTHVRGCWVIDLVLGRR